MMRLVQAGSGDPRDLVVVYHLNASADADVCAAVGPDACIVNDTVPQSDIGVYGSIGPGGIASLEDVAAWAASQVGAFSIDRIILVGYSAGYLGVRTQLLAGADPAAIVVADGIQTPRPGDAGAVAPWVAYAALARAGDRVFVASHSTQGQTNMLNTTDTLRLITGMPLVDAGNDHHAQGYVVLPRLLGMAMALLSSSNGIRPRWLKWLGIAGVIGVFLAGGIVLARYTDR